ncbi:MAG: outer membrane protein assembly factor BamB, partial [Acidovorax sp.]|nr:outer membrane protein assembly factor BamB [Acidovorax sp.]
MMHSVLHARLARPLGMLALASAVLLSGCSLWGGGSNKPKPLELGAMEPVLAVRQAWLTKVGPVDRLALAVHVNGSVVTVASDTGVVAAIDARTGGDVWRTQLGQPLIAGVGSDGQRAAVVS